MLAALALLAAVPHGGCGVLPWYEAASAPPVTQLLTAGTSAPARPAAAPLPRSRRIAIGVLGGLAAVSLAGAIVMTSLDGRQATSDGCAYQGQPTRPERCVWDLRVGYGIGYGVTAGLLAGLAGVLLWPAPAEGSVPPARLSPPLPPLPLSPAPKEP